MNAFLRRTECSQKRCFSLALSLVLPVVTGCASGGQTEQTHYRVFAEWLSSSPVAVWMDKQVVTDSVPYQGSVGPLPTSAGTHILVINCVGCGYPSGGFGPPPLADGTFSLAAGTQSSFYYVGPGVLGGFILQSTDDTAPAANPQAKLRVVIAANTTQAFDVYVVLSGSGPTGQPTWSNLQLNTFGVQPEYLTLLPGTYDIDFTATGTTSVLYIVRSLTLAASQNRTVLLLENASPYSSATIADLN